MNNTNSPAAIAGEHLAQQAGINVSATELTMLAGIAGAAVRWLQLEYQAIAAAGGIKTIFRKFVSGNPK